jgi:hypothetical protein
MIPSTRPPSSIGTAIHRLGARLAQRHADHVAPAQLACPLGHAGQNGVEVQGGIDLAGDSPRHVGLVATPLVVAPARALLALPPRLLGVAALGGQSLERFDPQPQALVLHGELSSRMMGRRLHDGLP